MNRQAPSAIAQIRQLVVHCIDRERYKTKRENIYRETLKFEFQLGSLCPNSFNVFKVEIKFIDVY